MNDYQHMETPALVDMLAECTARLSRMRVEGGDENSFSSLKENIRLLQIEIEARKNADRKKFAGSDAETAGTL
jgi:hypothetical protein